MKQTSPAWPIEIIGQVESPFKEKFSVPRQPNLASAVRGKIHFFAPFNQAPCFAGLEQFSHIWLQFIFDKTAEQGWKPSVRPPRLGGNKKVGVFATRSPFRPNPIGLSCVELISVDINQQQEVSLTIAGLDLVDKTPIVDIKPYVPYADSLADASSLFSPQAPDLLNKVEFSTNLTSQIQQISQSIPEFAQVVEQVLLQDPRPAYHKKDPQIDRIYGVKLYNFDIRWQINDQICYVVAINPQDQTE
ncbi:tRNA (N6-threonylcarbamoyladenosine(37)-N6)-methyltransferase TrmO [Catenovulum sp. 2E275]|uniref:tRNA (N6-threonylcarbamoyladenosine(37)-N6)-methyltransferase TrmO n=1 Tax=Catenovulum sp. 2E275 TaxID=2980497 RepID=UPI0021CE8C8E|nr:tRNA (N6-threonylcarbamoyladenosine(37)-N6)-methyltransferase TrmO [Catenovulum sp. 2E275]MCU4676996.1 tRNA (N6-threonylcarbamoyladenosine(37)-N6)-methyltransferase TrmO [Catenovulum sp. 2E275]